MLLKLGVSGSAGRSQGSLGTTDPSGSVIALGCDAEPVEGVALGSEVLGVGGDAGVADQQCGHEFFRAWRCWRCTDLPHPN